MDLLHAQLSTLQQHLSFVSVDPINWKFYVQAFSWGITLFESYLLCAVFNCYVALRKILTEAPRLRQYPLYSKLEPPAVLTGHFSPEVFQKSQKYGKDKAQFSLVSGILKQSLDSFLLHCGFYAWSWEVAGKLLARFGYGSQYEVSTSITSTQ
jgi:STE24 endopeptidase